MVTQTEAVSPKWMVSFSVLLNRLSLMRNSLFYTYPPQWVYDYRKCSFVESNRYLIAVNDSDASVGTNVIYTLSHLCSLQLHSSASRPIMFVADNAWLLTCKRLVRYNFCQSFSKHLHFIRVTNIKWLYVLNTLEAYFNSGSEVSHAP